MTPFRMCDMTPLHVCDMYVVGTNAYDTHIRHTHT